MNSNERYALEGNTPVAAISAPKDPTIAQAVWVARAASYEVASATQTACAIVGSLGAEIAATEWDLGFAQSQMALTGTLNDSCQHADRSR